jgi:hypothetical protein
MEYGQKSDIVFRFEDLRQQLNPSDLIELMKLHKQFASHETRERRHKRPKQEKQKDPFLSDLEMIQNFAVRGDSEDGKRFAACGIAWINDNIVVNNRIFPILLKQSKSTINAKFKQLGYSKITMTVDVASKLMKLFPDMQANTSTMRQWSVRGRLDDNVKDLVKFETILDGWWADDFSLDEY